MGAKQGACFACNANISQIVIALGIFKSSGASAFAHGNFKHSAQIAGRGWSQDTSGITDRGWCWKVLTLGADDVIDEGKANAVAASGDDAHHVGGGKRADFSWAKTCCGFGKSFVVGADLNGARFHGDVDWNSICKS